MEEKIMNLLTELNQDMKGLKKEFISFKKDVNDRFNSVDRRLDGLDLRFDGVDRRLNNLDIRLDGVDRRLDNVDLRLDGVDRRIEKMDANLDRIGYQFEQTNVLKFEDVDFLTAKVEKLEKDVFILNSKNKD
ncbi:hypothetical protein FZC79_22395 [Rossellomorea vietnamensis]|uniref:t-SNARE coiled-coil homology domain-containing protein n=1 Tax=Rossellomorea vietnamensis TaxID=218284 RepID=A0A5D4K5P0_9BACI|nr:hypothetical protein [Rossellomorea vietnamensis]TYR72532.1 hypothetical protein FZC79_22395 [Rossellomorea vietnamensis]